MPTVIPIQQLFNAAGSVAEAAKITQEALTFPINYNDGSATLITAGTKFATQAEIADYLTSHSATNFKYVIECWGSLPDIVAHNITFNLATGIHRPRAVEPRFAAFSFDKKSIQAGVRVNINGVGPSSYRIDVASATITAVGPSAEDPYLDFTGTPFTGLDLRGRYLVLDTGQTTIINKNTASRLFVQSVISPVPASGFVGRPATILRNSVDDINYLQYYDVYVDLPEAGDALIWFNDLVVDAFGSYYDIITGKSSMAMTNVMADPAGLSDEFPSKAFNTDAFVNTGSYMYMSGCSIRGTLLSAVPQAYAHHGVYAWGKDARLYFDSCYIAGVQSGMEGYSGEFSLVNTMFDIVAYTTIELYQNAEFSFYDYGGGKINLIRNGAPIRIYENAQIISGSTRLQFEGSTGPCIQFNDTARTATGFYGNVSLENGPAGGNVDVGIEIIGMGSLVSLGAGTNVTGTNGNVRMADGDIWTYANITLQGPITDRNGNLVRKS